MIESDIDRVHSLDPELITSLIARCCQIKADVVSADEREGGLTWHAPCPPWPIPIFPAP